MGRLQRGMGGRRTAWTVVGLSALAVVAAACSSGSSSPTTTTGAAAGTTGGATVMVATKGSLGAILVDGSGMTLYTYKPDPVGASVCTGGCAQIWMPLRAPSASSPVAGNGVTGLGTVKRPDGSLQVAVDGHPLYLYQGDQSPSDALGQGVDGVWYVVHATASGTSSSSTTTTSSGGYGY